MSRRPELLLTNIDITCGDHYGSRVSSDPILKNACQFGVSVWDEGRPIHECGNDIAESGQGQVYFPSFLEPHTLCPSFGDSLRSGEVNQIQFPDFDVLTINIGLVGRLNRNLEDGMTSGTVFIHVCRTYNSTQFPFCQQVHDFLETGA